MSIWSSRRSSPPIPWKPSQFPLPSSQLSASTFSCSKEDALFFATLPRAYHLELRTKQLPSTSLNAEAVPHSSRLGSITNSHTVTFQLARRSFDIVGPE